MVRTPEKHLCGKNVVHGHVAAMVVRVDAIGIVDRPRREIAEEAGLNVDGVRIGDNRVRP